MVGDRLRNNGEKVFTSIDENLCNGFQNDVVTQMPYATRCRLHSNVLAFDMLKLLQLREYAASLQMPPFSESNSKASFGVIERCHKRGAHPRILRRKIRRQQRQRRGRRRHRWLRLRGSVRVGVEALVRQPGSKPVVVEPTCLQGKIRSCLSKAHAELSR